MKAQILSWLMRLQVTGAEPATPVAETGGDGDPQAPAAPSPSEGAAPTVMGDAPKAPEGDQVVFRGRCNVREFEPTVDFIHKLHVSIA